MLDQPDRKAEPYFSQPVRQILTMLIIVGLVGFGAYVAYPRVASVFLANPWLSGFIGLVFIIGVLACFWQVTQLVTSVNWIEGFAAGTPGHELTRAPRLLAPLAALLRRRGKSMQISSSSAGSILDSVATRIDEARDITRYIVNLLIFLGLLGTFWGLATTIPAVIDTIRSLEPTEGESGIAVFGRLMTGLEAQLGGMGTAFGSSLLGLAGSLVVGLLELFAGHGQNRFYRELEEWLSTITRLGFAGTDSEPGEQGQAIMVLDQMAQQLEAVQTMVEQTEASRAHIDLKLGSLLSSVDRMIEAQGAAPNVVQTSDPDKTAEALAKIAKGQERMIETLEAAREEGGAHIDAESRMRLRSIDVQLLRILEEMSAGRQESVADLRGEIAALTRAIRELNGGR